MAGASDADDVAMALKDSCSHCGKQRSTLKRCSVCKKAWYCGAQCQNAGWKKHEKTCEPPLPLDDVWEKMNAATAARDWRGVLAWEGRLAELLEGLAGPGGCSDATCEGILAVFCRAHVELHHKDNALAAIGRLERLNPFPGFNPFSGCNVYHHFRNDAFYDLDNLLKVRETGKRKVVLLQPLPQTLYTATFDISPQKTVKRLQARFRNTPPPRSRRRTKFEFSGAL